VPNDESGEQRRVADQLDLGRTGEHIMAVHDRAVIPAVADVGVVLEKVEVPIGPAGGLVFKG